VSVLTLKEYIEIDQHVQSWETEFSPEEEAAAENFEVTYNEDKKTYSLCLFDSEDKELGCVQYTDPDVMMAFLEEVFDLGDLDAVPVYIDGTEDEMMYLAITDNDTEDKNYQPADTTLGPDDID
jgi:hypothetical protein